MLFRLANMIKRYSINGYIDMFLRAIKQFATELTIIFHGMTTKNLHILISLTDIYLLEKGTIIDTCRIDKNTTQMEKLHAANKKKKLKCSVCASLGIH